MPPGPVGLEGLLADADLRLLGGDFARDDSRRLGFDSALGCRSREPAAVLGLGRELPALPPWLGDL
eukprot:7026513-Heterocapsa_arctica.AAC.1